MDDYIFFSRDRFNSTPITNYFKGTDNYLKGLNPEKNNYKKSNNYLEKKKFLREHFPSFDLMRYNKSLLGLNSLIKFHQNYQLI